VGVRYADCAHNQQGTGTTLKLFRLSRRETRAVRRTHKAKPQSQILQHNAFNNQRLLGHLSALILDFLPIPQFQDKVFDSTLNGLEQQSMLQIRGEPSVHQPLYKAVAGQSEHERPTGASMFDG